MPKAMKLSFHDIAKHNPLDEILSSRQAEYLKCYFRDLEAAVVIEEPNYFDRDYLAEFAAFYSISSKGYPNICRRFHFFSDPDISRKVLKNAAANSPKSLKRLQDSYLGFVVVRPIPAAPLGRTVVRWYVDQMPTTPRVVSPSRDYSVHLAGITLFVKGLAWQQQDTGVGACATISLWTMLHSSAFDDHHAIPTTADITRAAHKRASLGARIFPSTGLNIYQICEAIKEHNLSPVLVEGDVSETNITALGFSRERFSSSCAAFLRSGYPILIIGTLGPDGHAICATGFRSCAPNPVVSGCVSLQEGGIQHLYIHDDNLGPNIRFNVSEATHTLSNGNNVKVVQLKPSAPNNNQPCPTDNYPEFTPRTLIVAVHNDLRTSPDTLHRAGLIQAHNIVSVVNHLMVKHGIRPLGLTVSTRFIKLSDYLGSELSNIIGMNPKLLSKVRLALCEKVQPMSLHLGVVRIGLDDSTQLLDVLYDTTDSDRNHPVFACVTYDRIISAVVQIIMQGKRGEFGVEIEAFV